MPSALAQRESNSRRECSSDVNRQQHKASHYAMARPGVSGVTVDYVRSSEINLSPGPGNSIADVVS
jgi:hypothetical protein